MSRIILAGHSLGAARAALLAYARLTNGLPVDRVILLGCPNPGSGKLARITTQASVASFRNRRDLVTCVPLHLDWLGEDAYEQPAHLIRVDAPWRPDAGLPDWGPFNDHHIELYQQGVRLWKDAETIEVTDQVACLYGDAGEWDWLHAVDGQYWGLTRMKSGARLLIARGSKTARDWLDDFDAVQVPVMGAGVSAGFWAGVGPILSTLNEALA